MRIRHVVAECRREKQHVKPPGWPTTRIGLECPPQSVEKLCRAPRHGPVRLDAGQSELGDCRIVVTGKRPKRIRAIALPVDVQECGSCSRPRSPRFATCPGSMARSTTVARFRSKKGRSSAGSSAIARSMMKRCGPKPHARAVVGVSTTVATVNKIRTARTVNYTAQSARGMTTDCMNWPRPTAFRTASVLAKRMSPTVTRVPPGSPSNSKNGNLDHTRNALTCVSCLAASASGSRSFFSNPYAVEHYAGWQQTECPRLVVVTRIDHDRTLERGNRHGPHHGRNGNLSPLLLPRVDHRVMRTASRDHHAGDLEGCEAQGHSGRKSRLLAGGCPTRRSPASATATGRGQTACRRRTTAS